MTDNEKLQVEWFEDRQVVKLVLNQPKANILDREMVSVSDSRLVRHEGRSEG